jgi:hypothetical protein
MENNIENKARFFALYWGQEVYALDYSGGVIGKWENSFPVIKKYYKENDIKETYLLLKPLSAITDEDSIKVGYVGNFHFLDAYKSQFKLNTFSVKAADYLRSKGYALPWMDLSVDNLLKYGWVKLINNEKI